MATEAPQVQRRRGFRVFVRNRLAAVARGLEVGVLRIGPRTASRVLPAELVPSDARLVVILGAGLSRPDMVPSPLLAHRLDAALEILRRLDRPIVVVSGDDDGKGYSEPAAMRRYLIDRGIPPEAIAADPRGFSTTASVANVAARFELHGDPVVFVSTDYHLPRILILALGRGLNAFGVASHGNYAFLHDYVRREEVARVKDWTLSNARRARRGAVSVVKAALRPPLRAIWRGLAIWRRLPRPQLRYLEFLRAHRRRPVRVDPQRLSDKMFSVVGRAGYARYRPYVDKLAVREVIAQHLGPDYSAPLLAVLDDADSFDHARTPDGSILKPSHLSGAVERFRRDQDPNELRLTLRRWLERNYAAETGEMQYRDIPARILVEEDVSRGGPMLTYSCFLFRGNTEVVYVHDQADGSWQFDRDHQYLQYSILRQRNWPPLPRPEWFGELRDRSERLSRTLGFEFVRLDWFGLPDRYYFNEFTFTPKQNLFTVSPEKEDLRLGSLIDLDRI